MKRAEGHRAAKAEEMRQKNEAAAAKALAAQAPEEDGDSCLICTDRLEFVAVGECDHAVVCFKCSSRLRQLFNETKCVLCKRESKRVFVVAADEPRGSYSSMSSSTWDGVGANGEILDRLTKSFFSKRASKALEELSRLRSLECSFCDSDFRAKGTTALVMHWRTHGKFSCEICDSHRGLFVQEAEAFASLNALKTHQKRQHPTCKFCGGKRHFNSDALHEHLNKAHESCFVCARSSRSNEYYKNFSSLERHFLTEHFPCTQEECVEKKFVVFGSQGELTGHMLREHPTVRVNRRIQVSHTGTRPMDGAEPVHRFVVDDGGVLDGDDDDDDDESFPQIRPSDQDFPELQGGGLKRGGPKRPEVAYASAASRARRGVGSQDFPSLGATYARAKSSSRAASRGWSGPSAAAAPPGYLPGVGVIKTKPKKNRQPKNTPKQPVKPKNFPNQQRSDVKPDDESDALDEHAFSALVDELESLSAADLVKQCLIEHKRSSVDDLTKALKRLLPPATVSDPSFVRKLSRCISKRTANDLLRRLNDSTQKVEHAPPRGDFPKLKPRAAKAGSVEDRSGSAVDRWDRWRQAQGQRSLKQQQERQGKNPPS